MEVQSTDSFYWIVGRSSALVFGNIPFSIVVVLKPTGIDEVAKVKELARGNSSGDIVEYFRQEGLQRKR